MRPTLLLGYGNTLRSDDGAGVRAAEELSRALPGARLVVRHELQLELAETIAQFDDVFFLDASGTGEHEVRALPVVPEESVPNTGSHTCSPGALLGLCRSLYGRMPARTTLVTIPAESFDFGEELSAFTRAKLAECVTLVLGMVGTH
jgi:hydrogenase maturation protease